MGGGGAIAESKTIGNFPGLNNPTYPIVHNTYLCFFFFFFFFFWGGGGGIDQTALPCSSLTPFLGIIIELVYDIEGVGSALKTNLVLEWWKMFWI